MKYAHKIIDTTYYDVKAEVPGETWMLEVPEEAVKLVKLIRVPLRGDPALPARS